MNREIRLEDIADISELITDGELRNFKNPPCLASSKAGFFIVAALIFGL